MPQYHIGHIGQIRKIQQHVKNNYSALRITGAPFEVVGLPDCIQQGKMLWKNCLMKYNNLNTF